MFSSTRLLKSKFVRASSEDYKLKCRKGHLRQILGFIGIDDVQTVRAEGMNIPPLAIHAVPNGEKAVEALVI